MRDYDYKCIGQKSGVPIEYGFIKGGSKAVFIKAGLSGSIYGYENKYLEISEELNRIYGYTVMVASNPQGSADALHEGVDVLKTYTASSGLIISEISYMGFSNGAYLGFVDGYKYGFARYLLINSPLVINFHKMKRGLTALTECKVQIVYGELDPSYKYVGLLESVLGGNVSLKIIPRADHQFRGMNEQFKTLPIEFFR